MFLGYPDKRPQKWLEIGIGLSRIGDTYANAVPIHLENWLWADIDYDVSLVQFILRVDQLKDPANWHRIGTGLADWDRIGKKMADFHWIGTGLADGHRIGKKKADWHRIGRLATDWLGIGSRLAS